MGLFSVVTAMRFQLSCFMVIWVALEMLLVSGNGTAGVRTFAAYGPTLGILLGIVSAGAMVSLLCGLLSLICRHAVCHHFQP